LRRRILFSAGQSVQIVPYEFINAERLRYGHYPVLDTILYRWTRRIEETLFEQVGVEVYAGASVFEEMKFSTFYATLRRPRPIYFFELEPQPGLGLFVVDNRFSAFCLREGGRSGGGREEIKLTPANQERLQRIVQELLADFAQCWQDVAPVSCRLRKLTTYPFRARILNPYENCFVAQIALAGRNISSRLTWCLPRPMLEALLPALSERTVIPPVQPGAQSGERPSAETVLHWLNYGVQVRVGQMSVADAARRISVGAVVPLQVEPGSRAVVEVEGTPVLRASLGEVDGRFAFKVEGPYEPPVRSALADPARFQPLRWPEVSAE
jgi:flagellar motor switch protein FliM